MKNMIISYDLRNQRNYEKLINAIKNLGSSSHLLESVWYVKTTHSAVQCRDELKKHLDKDDGIAVFDCSNNTWATYGVNAEKMQLLWHY